MPSQRGEPGLVVAAASRSGNSAAEVRAAAAEKRLAALTAQEMEPESEEEQLKDDFGSEGDDDVPDPYLDPDERREAMEEEMDEDERERLRGGWEAFIAGNKKPPTPSSEEANELTGPSKRHRVSSEEDAGCSKPNKTTGFMVDLVREEPKRGLGLSSTTTRKDGAGVGLGAKAEREAEKRDDSAANDDDERNLQPHEDGWPGWRCGLCTFINILDHGRCGRYSKWRTSDLG